MLNGDHSVYERIRPLRTSFEEKTKLVESLERRLASTERDIYRVLDEKLTATDPEYQHLKQQRNAARRVVDLCRNAQTLANRATKQIDTVGRDKDGDLSAVSSQTKLLWKAVADLNKHGHDYGLVSVSELAPLKSRISGRQDLPLLTHAARQVQISVGAMLEQASADARAFEAARERRLEAEREQLAREVSG